jgi:hypothetical protein
MATNRTKAPTKKNGTAMVAANGNGTAVVRLSREDQVATLGRWLAANSSTLHRLDAARSHGMQYSENRDLYVVAGYPRTLSYTDFWALYDRDPIAGRIIDMLPEDTWREPPEVLEMVEDRDEDAGQTAFEGTWAELAARLDVWSIFEQADRLARIGRYSVVVIGAGVGDDAALSRPITTTDANGVLYLSVFDEAHARIDAQDFDLDPGSPRFRLPNLYTIEPSSEVPALAGGQSASSYKVHWTRVIHIAEGLTSDKLYGRPVLRRLFNALHDLAKVTASTAEAFWQRVAGLLIASIDADALGVDETMLENIDDDLKAVFHDLRRYIIGKGIDVKRLMESEPNPAEAAKLYFTIIAAGEGIPFRRLLGNETGERSSSEDDDMYQSKVASRKQNHAGPRFVRALVDRLQSWTALPRVEYEVTWAEPEEESALEAADANLRRAQAAAVLTPVGGDPNVLVEIDSDRNVWLVPRDAGEQSPFEDMLEEQKQMERDALEASLKAPADEGGPAQEAA